MGEKISFEVSVTLTPAEAALVVVKTGVAAFGGMAGMVAIASDDGQFLEIIGQQGFVESVVQPLRRVPLQLATPATMAYQRCEPEFIETFADYRDCYPQLVAMTTSLTGTRALLCAPLLRDGKAIGVFGVTYPEDRRFSPEERASVLAFAERAAQALWEVIQRASTG